MKLFISDNVQLRDGEKQAFSQFSPDHNLIIVNTDPESIRFHDGSGKPHKFVICDFGYNDRDRETKEPLQTQFFYLNKETERSKGKKFGMFFTNNKVKVIQGIGGPIYENSAKEFYFGVFKIKSVIREYGRGIMDLMWELSTMGWKNYPIPKERLTPIEKEFASGTPYTKPVHDTFTTSDEGDLSGTSQEVPDLPESEEQE